jgi:hypothetical protein
MKENKTQQNYFIRKLLFLILHTNPLVRCEPHQQSSNTGITCLLELVKLIIIPEVQRISTRLR